MLKARTLATPIALVAVATLLAGCSGASGNSRLGGFGDELQPGYEESTGWEPTANEQPSEAWPPESLPEPPRDWSTFGTEEWTSQGGLPSAWTCVYSATYNDDWHDDVVCGNGHESHRPYLREWDDFIEEWELLESALEYEAELNSAR